MVDWIYFALLVVVVGLVGIGVGLVAGRAIAARASRREGSGEDAFMTPVGAPEDADARAPDASPTAGGGSADVARGGPATGEASVGTGADDAARGRDD